jgi:hypothetical protein
VGLSNRNEIYFVITKSWVGFYDLAGFFVTALAVVMPYFSMGARRLGYMRRSSAGTMPPPMAVMGLSSRWQSSGACPGTTRLGNRSNLGKINIKSDSNTAPRLCDVPPSCSQFLSLRIFEHVADSRSPEGQQRDLLKIRYIGDF